MKTICVQKQALNVRDACFWPFLERTSLSSRQTWFDSPQITFFTIYFELLHNWSISRKYFYVGAGTLAEAKYWIRQNWRIRLTCLHSCFHPIQIMRWFSWEVLFCLHILTCNQLRHEFVYTEARKLLLFLVDFFWRSSLYCFLRSFMVLVSL